MAKKIKISKKEALKQPDEFITTTAKFLKYIKENESKFIAAIIVVSLLVLGVSFGAYYLKKVNVMGFAQLSKALDETDLAKKKNILEDIKKSRFTDARYYSSFFLAKIYKDEGNTEKAKVELKDAEKIKDPFLKGSARILMVDLMIKENKLDEALKYAKEAPTDIPQFVKQELKLKEALILERKNNLPEAMKIYSEIEKSNPDFYLIRLVQSKSAM